MYIIVSYDIVNDKKRNKVAKVMKNYGKRVQKSVFECLIDDKEYVEMKNKLEMIINLETDSIRFYFICSKCKNNVEISGKGTVIEDEDVVIV